MLSGEVAAASTPERALELFRHWGQPSAAGHRRTCGGELRLRHRLGGRGRFEPGDCLDRVLMRFNSAAAVASWR